MPRRIVARTTTALSTALLLLFFACRSTFWREPEKEEPAKPLGPWHAGMDLRATYETFPPSGEPAATLCLLEENPASWAARWRLLAESRESIDLSYFILHEDVFGVSFLGHVLERAQAGVHVRVLLDAQGTKMSWNPRGNDYFDELLANRNVEIKLYRPLQDRILEAFLKLAPTAAVASEHDKILVADGRRSLIGGRNIGVEYFADPKVEEGAFQDTDLEITSRPIAIQLTKAFDAQFESPKAKGEWGDPVNLAPREEELLGAFRAMDDWLRGRPEGTDEKSKPWRQQIERHAKLRGALEKKLERPSVEAETRILDSQTRYGKADDPITQALSRLVQSAKREIFVESPYLVLSEEAVELLEAAGKRGVAITILTNSPVSSDNALSQAFFLEQWPEILARVPRMKLYVGGRQNTLHSKVLVFDGRLSLVGTYNLDPTSMAMNSEVMAAVWSQPFARRALERPMKMIAAGAPTVHEYRIRRHGDGRPVRDDAGKPVIAFGPENHCEPEEWKTLGTFWAMLRVAEKLPGFSPIF